MVSIISTPWANKAIGYILHVMWTGSSEHNWFVRGTSIGREGDRAVLDTIGALPLPNLNCCRHIVATWSSVSKLGLDQYEMTGIYIRIITIKMDTDCSPRVSFLQQKWHTTEESACPTVESTDRPFWDLELINTVRQHTWRGPGIVCVVMVCVGLVPTLVCRPNDFSMASSYSTTLQPFQGQEEQHTCMHQAFAASPHHRNGQSSGVSVSAWWQRV